MSRKRIILIAAICIVLAAAITGYMLWNKPHKEVKDASGVKITATELYNNFITDSAKARTLYTDKVVQVTGEVARLALNQQDQQIILIKTPVSGAYINCTMEEKTNAVKEGASVTVKGICSGYISGDAEMGLPGDVFLVRGYPFTK
ncbi:MAG: hypothetical protein IPP96_16455 [Chitinophagaceae bacterium]|nr:hypothetical protein [Chitinophagaceae bacterium]